MRNLSSLEVAGVCGGLRPAGDINCTIGTSGVNCTGTLSQWADAYDAAVDWTSRNVIEPVANWF